MASNNNHANVDESKREDKQKLYGNICKLIESQDNLTSLSDLNEVLFSGSNDDKELSTKAQDDIVFDVLENVLAIFFDFMSDSENLPEKSVSSKVIEPILKEYGKNMENKAKQKNINLMGQIIGAKNLYDKDLFLKKNKFVKLLKLISASNQGYDLNALLKSKGFNADSPIDLIVKLPEITIKRKNDKKENYDSFWTFLGKYIKYNKLDGHGESSQQRSKDETTTSERSVNEDGDNNEDNNTDNDDRNDNTSIDSNINDNNTNDNDVYHDIEDTKQNMENGANNDDEIPSTTDYNKADGTGNDKDGETVMSSSVNDHDDNSDTFKNLKIENNNNSVNDGNNNDDDNNNNDATNEDTKMDNSDVIRNKSNNNSSNAYGDSTNINTFNKPKQIANINNVNLLSKQTMQPINENLMNDDNNSNNSDTNNDNSNSNSDNDVVLVESNDASKDKIDNMNKTENTDNSYHTYDKIHDKTKKKTKIMAANDKKERNGKKNNNYTKSEIKTKIETKKENNNSDWKNVYSNTTTNNNNNNNNNKENDSEWAIDTAVTEMKPQSKYISVSLLVVLLGIIVYLALELNKPNPELNRLRMLNNVLNTQIENQNNQINNLNEENNQLKNEKIQLNNEYNELKHNNTMLLNDKTQLEFEKKELIEKEASTIEALKLNISQHQNALNDCKTLVDRKDDLYLTCVNNLKQCNEAQD